MELYLIPHYSNFMTVKSQRITLKPLTITPSYAPHTFTPLVGLPTRIYQTVHDRLLAFLVVIS